jgi:hypothetical protein
MFKYSLILLALNANTPEVELPYVKAPTTVNGNVGQWIPIKAESNGVTKLSIFPFQEVFPPEMIKNLKATIVQANEAGTYKLLAYTGNANGGSPPVIISVAVGQTPVPPGPNPPTPPVPPAPGIANLTRIARESLSLVNLDAATKSVNQQQLANGHESVAQQIDSKSIIRPTDILAAWRMNNNASVTNVAAWQPWGEKVSAELELQYKNGKLASPANWSRAMREIRDGLKP